MNNLLLFACVLVVTHGASFEKQWQEFKLNHGKTYKSLLEEERRFAIFQDNVRQVEEHNAKFAKGEVLYTKGINQFTDMTKEEFKAYLSPIKSKSHRDIVAIYNDTTLGLGVESVNWVTKGLVTPVKNQGDCGSCWAHSTLGAVEGQVAKTTGSLVSLSVQNLVDCNTLVMGCNGGDTILSYKYMEQNGVPTEAEYPYTGHTDICRMREGRKVSGYVQIADNEDALMSALNSVGPISVCVDYDGLKDYASGIFDDVSSCMDEIDHAVLLVGAGTEGGKDYWLIKNSYGTSWGMDGYFKLIRGKNACGINSYNTYPIL